MNKQVVFDTLKSLAFKLIVGQDVVDPNTPSSWYFLIFIEMRENNYCTNDDLYKLLEPLNNWPENVSMDQRDDQDERHQDAILVGRPENNSAKFSIHKGKSKLFES